jgi:transposase InsO family protein
VRSVREEYLDLILIFNSVHLRRVLLAYINDYYNVTRPHQGIEQQTPVSRGEQINTGLVQSRDVLGGIVHDYYRTPMRTALSAT